MRSRKTPGSWPAGITVGAAATLILSCGDDGVGPAPPPPPPPAPVATTVTVDPGSASFTALGETARFSAEVRDQNGQVMAGAAVAWASSDASVAAVDAAGQVTAAANGSATITATAGSVSGTAAVTVEQVVRAVAVSPSADTLVAVGDTVRLVAEATDANGHAVAAITEFEWSSSDTLVARVDDTGLVESLAEGAATVSATASEVTGDAQLTVVAPLPTTLAVSPDTVRFTALGQTEQLVAEVREQAGRVMAQVTVSWSSGDTLVVVVDSAGLLTAVGAGTTTVTAAVGEVADAVVVTVMQSAGSIVVSPSESTMGVGDTLRLVAEAFDENGNRVDGTVFSWSSSDAGVARVDQAGVIEAIAEGTARIRATADDVSGTAQITVENPDRAALVALYDATDGPNWVDNTNWLTDAPLGEWYGVETDASGRVVGIRLDGVWEGVEQTPHGLLGPIPPELGRLTALEVLSLWLNSVTGTIPVELGNLANLRVINLGLNRLIGVVPQELGNLPNLETLILRDNVLTGSIPPELGDLSSLRHLDLQENELTGPIPPELANLVGLSVLDLGWNNLTGPIPPSLGGLASLRRLVLRVNNLTGPIPPELANLANLRELLLDGNNLSGRIPPELANLGKLRWLWLYRNGLTGPIPPELGGLANLTSLSLWGNALTGSIPPELGELTKLRSLILGSNNLTGLVPTELGNLTALENLTLSGNLLTGSLPLNFVGLNKLQTLGCRRTEGVCLPATDEFREWARQVEARGNIELAVDIPFCDVIDTDALESLYEATNGSGWTRSDGWLEDQDLDRWHGVQTDSIGRVSGLDLGGNALSGHVPEALGLLTNLRELRIGDNALSGRLPLSLARVPLEEFDYRGTSLCAADDAGFGDWLSGIPRHSGTGVQCPPLSEREILEWLYRNTDGRNWRETAGWLTDAPLAEWHGVETDAAGRVVELRLDGNGLSGSLPVELGQLSELSVLNLGWNRLSGAVPPELGDLNRLTVLDLPGNSFRGSIPAELGQLSELGWLDLRGNRLSGPVPPELGDLNWLNHLHLSGNQLSGEIPTELGNLAELTVLSVDRNHLDGPIPPELGRLERLQRLFLHGNQFSGSIPSALGGLGLLRSIRLADNRLTGPIPPQLGALGRLSDLDLSRNQLTGPIPSELGDLANLQELQLFGNDLSEGIPAALGDLASLVTLNLGDNELSGPLPADLGRAVTLESLDLRSNTLTGPVPPEFGDLTGLKSLILADNPGLAGPLPSDFTGLEQFERFMAGETGLCRPADPRFDAWFAAIPHRRLVRCDGGAAVYLTQAVQSWDDPVPLLAGEPALLRVFVTAPESAATMPEVRATFYLDGAERLTISIPASTRAIPSEITEGDLALSANAEIPAWVMAPGLEMVIEVDRESTLDSALGVKKRIPDSGRMAVDVRRVPPFHLTLIPFLWETEPDSSVVESVSAMAADPDGHELLHDLRMLPIGELAVAARDPVVTSTQDISRRLAQVEAMRVMEGGSGYWMGIWHPNYSSEFSSRPAARGVARLGGRASMSTRDPSTIAHELGHNLSLEHAPCGSPNDVDPWFPHFGGSIGAWGYDFGSNQLVTPHAVDVMSYCFHSAYWISDFFFNKAVRHRLAEDGAMAAALAAEADRVRTLLLWGGRDEDGVPYLDPAFVVDAVPSLPVAGGDYTIEGATADGTPVFSYAFDMPAISDAGGPGTSFVFTLPAQAGWADNLASLTLSGPGGSATLDGTTNQPMAILRDPRTGQVRGFLSDLPAATGTAEAVARTVGQGLEVLFSRGIPGAGAWRR